MNSFNATRIVKKSAKCLQQHGELLLRITMIDLTDLLTMKKVMHEKTNNSYAVKHISYTIAVTKLIPRTICVPHHDKNNFQGLVFFNFHSS